MGFGVITWPAEAKFTKILLVRRPTIEGVRYGRYELHRASQGYRACVAKEKCGICERVRAGSLVTRRSGEGGTPSNYARAHNFPEFWIFIVIFRISIMFHRTACTLYLLTVISWNQGIYRSK